MKTTTETNRDRNGNIIPDLTSTWQPAPLAADKQWMVTASPVQTMSSGERMERARLKR